MTDPKHIPYLIQLLDDESELVRRRVVEELNSFGPNLKVELLKTTRTLTSHQSKSIEVILNNQKKIWLKRTWPNWFYTKPEHEQLELALSMLAEYLSGSDSQVALKEVLDDLAFTYQQIYNDKDPQQLAQFLFGDKGLKGEEDDYYNPQNSNLIYVIEEKKGIPISLASIYMLVGHRLGIPIEGCNFPGHFLSKIRVDGKTVFVDCFSGGQIIDERDLLQVQEELLGNLDNILKEKASVETMVRRFLANLIRAYQMDDDANNSEFIINLFKGLDERMENKEAMDITPDDIIFKKKPILGQGMIARHLRYGYRGIIVDVDSQCIATDSWYYGNQTQPNRNQPWYHVLVHGSDQVTYVAESNLVIESTKEKIVHPLLSYFFVKEKNGRYVRNNNPWPDADM